MDSKNKSFLEVTNTCELTNLEENFPIYLKNDIEALKEGIKNNSLYVDCLVNEVQGSVNSAYINGAITEEQCDYVYQKYIRGG